LRELRLKYPTLPWTQRLKVGDPSTLAVVFEDGLAVLGVTIAAISLILTNWTGNRTWDAVGSIIIGILLGIMAVILIIKNRAYLIGMSMPEDMQDVIIDMLNADPAIEKVLDFKSTTMDVDIYRIKCEIEFNGYVLLKEIYKTNSLREQYDEVKDDYEDFKKFCVDYADRIPRLVGKKIDDIEIELKKKYPGVKYIDIEIN
jgi:zinc transporter 9